MKKMVVLSMVLAVGLLNGTAYAQSQDDVANPGTINPISLNLPPL